MKSEAPMQKPARRWTRRDLLQKGGLALGLSLLSACAPQIANQGAPAGDLPAASPTAAPPTARPADRPFSASDPSAFVRASGRPQLVEFYATW